MSSTWWESCGYFRRAETESLPIPFQWRQIRLVGRTRSTPKERPSHQLPDMSHAAFPHFLVVRPGCTSLEELSTERAAEPEWVAWVERLEADAAGA